MLRCRTLLVILAATAAALALSVLPALAGPKAGSNLQFSGFALGRENYFTPQMAQATRQREDGAGGQAMRIVFIWNGTAVPAGIDLDAACNAAQVSDSQKVLMLNLRPDKNAWPSDQASLDAFNQTIDAIDAKIFWGSGSNGQPCWPAVSPPPQFMWMIGNEPNSKDFCNGDQSSNDLMLIHQVCARREALLLHSSYAFIKGQPGSDQLSQQTKYGHAISVVGGGLSSHDAPFDLLTKYFQAKSKLGYKSCDMDYFGYHPYALDAKNRYSGFKAVETTLVPALKAAGCPLKIIYTEMGAESAIPGGPQDGYNYNGSAPDPNKVLTVPESEFVGMWQQFVQIMQGQPDVIGFMNFELDDERDLSGWQSGFYYFSGYPKSFTAAMKPLFGSIGDPLAAKASLPPTR